MRETLANELSLFWLKLRFFGGKTTQAWHSFLSEGPGGVSKGDFAMMVLTLLAVALFLIGGVFRFLKAPWKKKGGMLLTALLVILIVAILLFFSLRAVELPQYGLEGSDAPTEKTVELGEESLTLSSRYSLSVGKYDPHYDIVKSEWVLQDDSVALPLSDGSLFLVTGIHSLPGKPGFAVQELYDAGDGGYAMLKRLDRSQGRICDDFLQIRTFTNKGLSVLPFSGEVGEELSFGGCTYLVLEREEDGLVFLENNPGWLDQFGETIIGLSLARPVGQDTVMATIRAWAGNFNGTTTILDFHDPRDDPEQFARMRGLLEAVLDEYVHILHGLSDEELTALLPDRVADQPERYAVVDGSFSIPCTRLLGMSRYDTQGSSYDEFVWLGTDADGQPVRYTLRNVAIAADYHGKTETYDKWRDAFEAGRKTPDESMSAFIGCRAVAYEGGWLLCPGKVHFSKINSMANNYYYLTMRPA